VNRHHRSRRKPFIDQPMQGLLAAVHLHLLRPRCR
jgi:hypothetical protein